MRLKVDKKQIFVWRAFSNFQIFADDVHVCFIGVYMVPILQLMYLFMSVSYVDRFRKWVTAKYKVMPVDHLVIPFHFLVHTKGWKQTSSNNKQIKKQIKLFCTDSSVWSRNILGVSFKDWCICVLGAYIVKLILQLSFNIYTDLIQLIVLGRR